MSVSSVLTLLRLVRCLSFVADFSFNQSRPDSSKITDPTLRSITERFLGIGETVFDTLQSTAVGSGYFKRNGRDQR